jgi:hypothetical protein
VHVGVVLEMSPFVHRYSRFSERSAPLFNTSPLLPVLGFGLIWGLLYVSISDSSLLMLVWLLLTPLVGMMIYVAWLFLIHHRYRSTSTSREFVETVERVREFVGYPDKIQVWQRASDRPLLMSSRTLLFAAILVSETTTKDSLDCQTDGETVLSFKIARLTQLSRIRVLLEAVLAFIASALVSWVGLAPLPTWLHSVVYLYPLAPGYLAVVLALQIRFEGLFQRTSIRYKHVYQIYRESAWLSFSRVFGPHEVPDKEKKEIDKAKSGTIAEKEAVTKQLISEADEILAKGTRSAGYHLSPVTQGTEKGSIDILKPRGYSRDDAICTIPKAVVRLMPRADMLGPYVVYEIADTTMRAREPRYGYYLSVPPMILLFAVMFVPLFTGGFPIENWNAAFIPLLLFCLYVGVAAVTLRIWCRKSLFRLEANLARQYPGYAESIKALVEAGYATGIGAVSLRDRLKRLQRVEVSEGTSH